MTEHRDSETFADAADAPALDDELARPLPVEADEADVIEQALAVPESDEDDYRA